MRQRQRQTILINEHLKGKGSLTDRASRKGRKGRTEKVEFRRKEKKKAYGRQEGKRRDKEK